MNLIAPLFVFLFWLGPPAALLLLALIQEQHRHAPNGTHPRDNIVLRCLGGGFIAALIWIVLVMLLVAITQAGNAGLWIVFTPWAFALGEGAAILWRRAPSNSS